VSTLRREHYNRRRSNSFDYCDQDDAAEDENENDSLCGLSVSTSVAFGMNNSVADDSDSEVPTPNDQQDGYPYFERPRGIIKLNSTVNEETNLVTTEEEDSGFPSEIINAIIGYLDCKALKKLRLTSRIYRDYVTCEQKARSRNCSIDTIFPNEVQDTIMQHLDLKSLMNLKLTNWAYKLLVMCEVKRRRLFAWTQSDLRCGFETRYQKYVAQLRELDKKRKLQISSMYDDDHPEIYYAACRELNRYIKRRGKNDHMRPSLLMRQLEPSIHISARLPPPVETIVIPMKQKSSKHKKKKMRRSRHSGSELHHRHCRSSSSDNIDAREEKIEDDDGNFFPIQQRGEEIREEDGGGGKLETN
jgi:hypothetical protein